jgi:hypothetical protein
MKTLLVLVLALALVPPALTAASPDFVPLFNGRDLSGWRIPPGDNGHWKVLDGVIDYDARSEAPDRQKDLWTAKEYGNFVLKLEWRIKETPGTYPMPDVLPDGTYRLGDDGKPILTHRPNADSGIYLRGTTKAQLNIWCWPVGSGEIYGYRNDASMPPEVRRATTPTMNADNPVGEWNTFEITLRGNRVDVTLNGKHVIVNAQLPGIPAHGPIGLQHHGTFKDGKYDGASSLVQFRNISIKELPAD